MHIYLAYCVYSMSRQFLTRLVLLIWKDHATSIVRPNDFLLIMFIIYGQTLDCEGAKKNFQLTMSVISICSTYMNLINEEQMLIPLS